MVRKRFWLGILVIIVVFGMAVVGCEEEPEKDTHPSTPTGLTGTVVSPNNSIKLTWNPVNNADEYWIQYKKSSDNGYQTLNGIKTTNHTITNLDYGTEYTFKIAVRNTDYYVSEYSSPISITTGVPMTASVSLSSMETRCFRHTDSILGTTTYTYTIQIRLQLSKGALWLDTSNSLNFSTAKSWVNMTGTPNVSSWTGGVSAYYGVPDFGDILSIEYTKTSSADNESISGLTATINSSKLTEMNSYTNVINSLTTGSSLSATSSLWTKNF